MNIGDFAEQIAKIGLPLIGALLPIPGGSAIGAALAAHIGAKSAEPGDILQTLMSSAEAVQKAKEFEATNSAAMMQQKMTYELTLVDKATDDVKSARSLAEVDINHGNAWTSALSALVRPAWGLCGLGLVGWSIFTKSPLDVQSYDMIKAVMEFYFGGKIVEAIAPHAAEAISRFAGK